MFDSRRYVHNIKEIPDEWIFEYYLNLDKKLDGGKVKLHSVFNDQDKTPSMFLSFNHNTEKYNYKCFSTGKSGDSINVVMELYNLSYHKACNKIIKDFKSKKRSCKRVKFKSEKNIQTKWKIANLKLRSWNTLDVEYWTSYNIGSNLLSEYNIKPILSYTLKQVDKNNKVVKEYNIEPTQYVYGFFKKDGLLYKIYNPKNKKKKFLILHPEYIQGSEQSSNSEVLIIMASLKDSLALLSLGIKVDIIAPNSENTTLSLKQINKLKLKYKYIITIFDNDKAGINAMKKYKELYDINYCYIPFENDIADLVKKYGVLESLRIIVPRIGKSFL